MSTDNNKDLKIKYLNDLFSNFSKKWPGHTIDRLEHTFFYKLMAYVRMYECVAELNKRLI